MPCLNWNQPGPELRATLINAGVIRPDTRTAPTPIQIPAWAAVLRLDDAARRAAAARIAISDPESDALAPFHCVPPPSGGYAPGSGAI
jgi:hypothetical protein